MTYHITRHSKKYLVALVVISVIIPTVYFLVAKGGVVQGQSLGVVLNVSVHQITTQGFSVLWQGLTGITSYDIRYCTGGANVQCSTYSPSSYETSIGDYGTYYGTAISGLSANTRYWVTVIAKSGTRTSSFSSSSYREITTLSLPACSRSIITPSCATASTVACGTTIPSVTSQCTTTPTRCSGGTSCSGYTPTTTQCGTGTQCLNANTPYCTGTQCVQCTQNSHCGTGQQCTNNACVHTTTCTKQESLHTCASPSTIACGTPIPNGTETCTDNAPQCSGGSSCSYTSRTKQCAGTGTQCPTGQQCTNNRCVTLSLQTPQIQLVRQTNSRNFNVIFTADTRATQYDLHYCKGSGCANWTQVSNVSIATPRVVRPIATQSDSDVYRVRVRVKNQTLTSEWSSIAQRGVCSDYGTYPNCRECQDPNHIKCNNVCTQGIQRTFTIQHYNASGTTSTSDANDIYTERRCN